MEAPAIRWARKIQALSQTGLAYAENPYDRERYEALRELAAEMMAASSGLPDEGFRCAFADQSGYATPKVDVRGAVFREGKVLLAREKDDGLWSLPGGWADVTDSPSQAVVREVREEGGVEVRCAKLVAVFDRDLHGHVPTYPFHIYKLLFNCELLGPAQALCHDISEAAFFDLDDLPPLSLRRILPEQIRLMHAQHRDPSLATVFD